MENGHYLLEDGSSVSVADAMADAVAGTVLYHPDEIGDLLDSGPADSADSTGHPTRTVEVDNCTTFSGVRALLADDPNADVACLNFASAKNPGGGFIGGSQAQEEALARASGLYACLLATPDYYQQNRANPSPLYTDHIIYSPAVPVFRDDDDRLLAEPYRTSIITAPAPNAGALMQNRPEDEPLLVPTMARRIRAVLAVAQAQGHRHLVLGAWGCGVFGNDPATVAELFREALDGGAYDSVERVVFAVLDTTSEQGTFGPFRDALASN